METIEGFDTQERKEVFQAGFGCGIMAGILISIIGIIFISLLSAQAKPLNGVRKQKQQTLQLPEEINQAKKGDLLQVEKTGDTLGFGFYRCEKFKK